MAPKIARAWLSYIRTLGCIPSCIPAFLHSCSPVVVDAGQGPWRGGVMSARLANSIIQPLSRIVVVRDAIRLSGISPSLQVRRMRIILPQYIPLLDCIT
jgi:hypothetical protein